MRAPFSFIKAAGGAAFDPATLALTGWWRASYSASPWVGTASAGASGTRDLTEATNPPSVGAAQNGLDPADFDGTNDQMRITLTLDDFVNASAASAWVLFLADTAAADAPAGQPYNNPAPLSTANSGYFIVGYSDAGVRCATHDGAYREVTVAASTGAYHLAQVRIDGALLGVRVDSGSWSTTACGAIADLTSNPIFLGTNVDQTKYFDGRILDVGLIDSVLSDVNFDNIKSYVNSRYALSL